MSPSRFVLGGSGVAVLTVAAASSVNAYRVSLPLTDAEPLPFATRWNRSALPLVAGQASVLLPAWVFQSVA